MTCLVYLPLTILGFGMLFGPIFIHVLNHPDVYHITVSSGMVLLRVYLIYINWNAK